MMYFVLLPDILNENIHLETKFRLHLILKIFSDPEIHSNSTSQGAAYDLNFLYIYFLFY